MQVLIENKAFHLKFGMKCLMLLGKNLGLKSYSEVVNHLAVLDNISDDLTFEQADLIEALIVAAAETHPTYRENEYSIHEVDVLSWVVNSPEEFAKAIKHLVESMPQPAGKSKPAATGRKKAAAKK